MSTQTATINNSLVKRKPAVPNAILAMGIFVFTELMFFTGLLSALLVIRGGAADTWLPPEQITLPVYQTAFNTFILFLSGVFLYFAGKNKANSSRAMILTLRAAVLGLFFVLFQGYEWVHLVGYGMTFTTSIFSACFYLLIGTHGLHALAGAGSLFYLTYKVYKKEVSDSTFTAYQMFWYMVILIWPILYSQLYFT